MVQLFRAQKIERDNLMTNSKVVRLQTRLVGRATTAGATWLDIQRSRLQMAFNKMLNKLGVPGAIKNGLIEDQLTGQTIRIQTGIFFTLVSINGRDYYFGRITGEFDGTGSGCC